MKTKAVQIIVGLFLVICSPLPAQVTRFAYVINEGSNAVSVYRVDRTTGALTPSSVTATGSTPSSVAIDPAGRFAFVANSAETAGVPTISVYTIEPHTGALTQIPGSPFPTPATDPIGMAVHPSGNFLYVAHDRFGGAVSAYSIDAATGALAQLPGSPYPTGLNTWSVTTDPAGKFLFVAVGGAANVPVYSINPNTGALTPVPGSPFPAPGNNHFVDVVDPTGRFLYISSNSSQVLGYSVDPNTGTPTPVAGSPFAAGSGTTGVAMHPTGRFLYAANQNSQNVSAYSLDSNTGALSPVPGSPFPAGSGAFVPTIDPAGTFLYVPNAYSNNVSVYAINSNTGALAQVLGSPFATGTTPVWIAVVDENPTAAVSLLPTHGGNTGNVTVQVFGSGFQSGATVKLTGLGSDIIGTNTTVPNASAVATTFDLTGTAPGVRNVVVTNPDNTTTTVTGGFTVEQGGGPQISVNIIGRPQIRIGAEQIYYFAVSNSGNVDAPIVALTSSSSGDAQLSSNSASRVSSLAAVKKRMELGSDVANQASPMDSPLQPSYVGPVTAGSSVALPVRILEPSPSCSLFQGFEDHLTAVSCDVLSKASDIADAYLNKLYALWLANTISWAKAITPITQGGLGTCFNLADLSTKVSCVIYKITDGSLEALIKGAEDAKNKICGLQIHSQCPGNCLLPQSLTDIAGIAKGLHDAEDQLEPLFNMATIPISEVTALESQVALFETQALSLPPTAFSPKPLNPLPVDSSASLQVCGVNSLDPNAKSGSTGIGPLQYVSGVASLPYLISFENQLTATAPAQTVTITDTLNTNLNLSTVTLGSIMFPNQVITPPSIPLSVAPFTTTADLRPTKNLLVRINASVNTTTGILTWTFQSLDPATNQPPTDPLAGFLPPGAEGSVFFTVMPKSTVTTGTVISNTATVVFDVNPPINTPTWSNTIDDTKPSSHVNSLAATQSAVSFPVSWAGSDIGAGVQDFTVYASDNGGAFTAVFQNVTTSSALFTGIAGHTYGFYTIARDLVGNVEGGKTAAEAITKIVADATPPVIVPSVTGTLGSNGWYRSSVSVTWSVNDPESGIVSSTGCTPTTLTADTAGVTLTCSATNGAGLTASVPVSIKIDRTPPVIYGTPAAGCTLWPVNQKLVTVATISAADALSGLAPGSFKVTGTSNQPIAPTDPMFPDIVIAPDGNGGFVVQLRADRLGTSNSDRVYTLAATANDLAGNTATTTAICTVPHDQGK